MAEKKLQTPIIALQVRTVPDYMELYKLVKNREYWDQRRNGLTEPPIKEEKDELTALREIEESMRVDSSGKPSFLPIPFQKIVATSLIITNAEGKTFLHAFAGDELFVVSQTWQKIMENYPTDLKADHPYPIIVTSDRKKASLPLLMSKSLSMYTKCTEKLCQDKKLGKMGENTPSTSIKERSEAFWDTKKEERTEEGLMFASLQKAAVGWYYLMDNEDKWENRKPNYTSPYSKYQPDTVYDFHTQGSSLYDAELTDSLVATNSWGTLAEYSTAQLLDAYKAFLVSRHLRNGEPIPENVMALTLDDITTDPEKKKTLNYRFEKPKYNPSIPAQAIEQYNIEQGIKTDKSNVPSLADLGR